MKFKKLFTEFFILIFLLQTVRAAEDFEETISFIKNVFGFVTAAKGAISSGNNVYAALKESNNLNEFVENLDSSSQHQKKVESKLEQIQNSVAIIKDKVGNIEFGIDLKHFNSHVKYPTKHVFNAIQKFIELPSNSTIIALNEQCYKHPPNSILETMGDILSENWLMGQAQHFKYHSHSYTKIIHKVDHIAESLAIAQAACSGLHGIEDANYEFKKLKENIKIILSHVEHSKQIMHDYAFNYSKIIVEEYVSKYSNKKKNNGEKNVEIASNLLEYFMENYNYGVFYTIFVSHVDNSNFIGNFAENSAYSVHSNGINVFVLRAPGECFNRPDKTVIGWTCLTANELSSYFKHKCGTKLSCVVNREISQCANNWFGRLMISQSDTCYDVLASNGGICQLYTSCFNRQLVTLYFPSNFTSKTLKTNRYKMLLKSHNFEQIDRNYNTIEPTERRIDEYPEYLEEKKLFIGQNLEIGLDTFLSLLKKLSEEKTTQKFIPKTDENNLESDNEVITFPSVLAKNSAQTKIFSLPLLFFFAFL